jgi:ribosomal protein S18 acetylase RimI-like enzyme
MQQQQIPSLWKASEADVDSLFELDNHCYKKNYLSKQQWKRILSNSNYLVLVAGDLTNPLAFVVAKTNKLDTNTILRLGVAEEFRRQELATGFIDLLGENRRLCIRLRESNEIGIRFCCGRGFKCVELLRNAFGTEDGLVFTRTPEETANGPDTKMDAAILRNKV